MPLVEVHQLSYRYPDGTEALREVSLALEEGERVGLIGPNGAGKSTLLWHLNGLLPEHPGGRDGRRGGAGEGGSVRVAALELTAENLPAVRRTVGMVFQDPDDQLFCPTVREDVAFGPLNLGLEREEVAERVREALEAVELTGCDDKMPHHLSVGQRKRACLAGVLACRPRVLALDEPTANLDPRGRRQLLSILERQACALLIASHDLELILALTPRVILLDGGRVHADGPAGEILGDEALMLAHGLEKPASLK